MPKNISKNGDFLNPAEQHTLTEQECNLISFYRCLSKSKKEVMLKVVFKVALEGTKPKSEKIKEK